MLFILNRVVITARSTDKLERVAERCKKYTKDVLLVPADVGKEEDCRELVERSVATFGGIDVLILNAAYSVVEPFEAQKQPFENVQKHLQVNLMQCVFLTKFSLPYIRKSKGIIVPVSSMAGLIGSWGSSAYGASKHAIHGFFKALRLELEDDVGISILPLPYVKTETADENLKRKFDVGLTANDCASRMLRMIPQRKLVHLMTLETWFGATIYNFSPWLANKLILNYLEENFEVMKQYKQK